MCAYLLLHIVSRSTAQQTLCRQCNFDSFSFFFLQRTQAEIYCPLLSPVSDAASPPMSTQSSSSSAMLNGGHVTHFCWWIFLIHTFLLTKLRKRFCPHQIVVYVCSLEAANFFCMPPEWVSNQSGIFVHIAFCAGERMDARVRNCAAVITTHRHVHIYGICFGSCVVIRKL